VLVEGRLVLEKWEDKDGGQRQKLSVTAENVQFLTWKEEEDDRRDRGRGRREEKKPRREEKRGGKRREREIDDYYDSEEVPL